jgi:hypothetical protein
MLWDVSREPRIYSFFSLEIIYLRPLSGSKEASRGT